VRGHACGHAGQRRGSTRPWSSTLKRVLVEETAAVATTSATAVIKNASNRERPDGSDNEGLPSARSSRAFAYHTMGAMNIDVLPVPAPVQTGLRLSLTGLATATAWARVEGAVSIAPQMACLALRSATASGTASNRHFWVSKITVRSTCIWTRTADFQVSLGLQ
jgi:hypothetical protein